MIESKKFEKEQRKVCWHFIVLATLSGREIMEAKSEKNVDALESAGQTFGQTFILLLSFDDLKNNGI